MRRSPRSLRPLAVLSGTLVLGALSTLIAIAGCSGAASQEVLDSKASGSGTSGASGRSGTSGSGTSGTASGGTSGASGTSGSMLDASSDGPIENCPSEMEPNDSPGTANTLGATLCGFIKPNSESDFLTFRLADKTTSMQLTFTGQVTLKVYVAGQTVTLGNGGSPKVPFYSHQDYIVEIRAVVRGNMVPWQVNLIQQ